MMEYEGVICRPPMALGAFQLPVAVGCAYNQCTFCNFYKKIPFRVIPLEEVERELALAGKTGQIPRSIFLGDGNPFVLPTDYLLQLLSLIRRYFPNPPPVHMDATIRNIEGKSDDELRALRQGGVEELYVGIECGVDDLLALMRKGHTVREAKEQLLRLRQAGIEFGAHLMLGTGGAGRGADTAKKTAELLNETHPKDVVNVELFVHPDTELYRQCAAGDFCVAGALESLLEERALIEQIQVPLSYDGFHFWREFHVWGALPDKRQAMLDRLNRAIEACAAEDGAERQGSMGTQQFCPQRVRITPL